MTRRRAGGDAVDGILLLDKPAGMTSNAALQQCKRLLNARKAGHTGSLDPIATGLLPLCFGEATKVSGFLLDADKRYRARFLLGVTTDTGDAEGSVLGKRPVRVTGEELEAALERFRGEIRQVPPMYSAIKREGQPLYKLARQGIEVEREPRRIRVHELRLVERAGDELELDIHCESGFYVRALAQDLGEALGCGAHVVRLERSAVGAFHLDEAVTLDALERLTLEERRAGLVGSDAGLRHLPGVNLSMDAAYYLCRGQAVKAADIPRAGWVRLYAEGPGFLGIGMVTSDGRVTPKRLFNLR